jgi:hypothetical protein
MNLADEGNDARILTHLTGNAWKFVSSDLWKPTPPERNVIRFFRLLRNILEMKMEGKKESWEEMELQIIQSVQEKLPKLHVPLTRFITTHQLAMKDLL